MEHAGSGAGQSLTIVTGMAACAAVCSHPPTPVWFNLWQVGSWAANTLDASLQPPEIHMPQSTKDSNGGKSHAAKTTGARSSAPEAAVKKSAAKGSSGPTGPQRHGEKKTTP